MSRCRNGWCAAALLQAALTGGAVIMLGEPPPRVSARAGIYTTGCRDLSLNSGTLTGLRRNPDLPGERLNRSSPWETRASGPLESRYRAQRDSDYHFSDKSSPACRVSRDPCLVKRLSSGHECRQAWPEQAPPTVSGEILPRGSSRRARRVLLAWSRGV